MQNTLGEKNSVSNLVRHKETGGYYARGSTNGKEVWWSFKTRYLVGEARTHDPPLTIAGENVPAQPAFLSSVKIRVERKILLSRGQNTSL
jgi:hypothetical protein